MLPFLWKTWLVTRQCKRIITDFKADAVLGMGGFTSLPPVYAAHRLGLKTFIHDSNARPGRANVLTSRFCSQVFLGLDAAKCFFKKRSCVTTGTPVRPEILALPTRAEAAARFGLDPAQTTILITGGSQGARRLNELAAEAVQFLPTGFQILHIAGTMDEPRVKEISHGNPNHHILGFCDQMPSALACADLVIARSGASSLTEIATTGLPSILVPFPYAADDHQTCNAQVFVTAGAALCIQERNLNAETLASAAISILNQPQTRQSMKAAAIRLSIPDAATRVSTAIEASLSLQ